MKKLMIVLAAGVLAIGTNAASINWTATKGYLYDGDGDSSAKITSGTAYLVLSTYGQSDLVSLFASNDGNAAATLTTLQGKAQTMLALPKVQVLHLRPTALPHTLWFSTTTRCMFQRMPLQNTIA